MLRNQDILLELGSEEAYFMGNAYHKKPDEELKNRETLPRSMFLEAAFLDYDISMDFAEGKGKNAAGGFS